MKVNITTELLKYLNNQQEKVLGLPVGIQVVGLPFQEEKILGLMKVI
jgi:Asp-tRNA(Asn)/Glu-tRNA(Gln) amidotransferase A subunit family amidase